MRNIHSTMVLILAAGTVLGCEGASTRQVTLPAGSEVEVQLAQTVSSATSRPGDLVVARVVEPVRVGQDVVVEPGSEVTGAVAAVVPAKKMGGQASLDLEFHTLKLESGEEVAVQASVHRMAKSQTGKDAATIGGAAAGGALLGRLIGHNDGNEARGTAAGALVGGAAGTAVAASNKGDEVTLPEGATLRLRLEAAAEITVVAANREQPEGGSR
jgi:hypothetical protein